MAVATNSVFSHTDALVQTWDLGAATPKGTLVVKNDIIGVTLTNTVGITDTKVTQVGPYSIVEPTEAGVGNDKATAVGQYAAGVALDGTWEFADITGGTLNTAQGTPVFATSAGALTLTATDNTRVGVVNFPASYHRTAAKTLPVAIGV